MLKAKKYRENLKLNKEKWEELKRKERLRVAYYRLRLKDQKEEQMRNSNTSECTTTTTTTEEQRRNATERQRKRRAKLKAMKELTEMNNDNEEESVDEPGYKSKQSLAKDVERVRAHLPQNIERKKIVLRELLKLYCPEAAKILNEAEKRQRRKKNKKPVVMQYKNEIFDMQDDDSSYQNPTATDPLMIYLKNGHKIKKET